MPEKAKTYDLTNEHELHGVTSEMIDWWWFNMVDPRYYKLWHPADHISIEWEVPPTKESNIGAIHVAQERIGVIPASKIRIKTVSPASSPIKPEYSHVRATCIIDSENRPVTWITHEYEARPHGTIMRSTFRMPADTPGQFIDALRQHNKEEMGQFPKFLPELYKKKAGRSGQWQS